MYRDTKSPARKYRAQCTGSAITQLSRYKGSWNNISRAHLRTARDIKYRENKSPAAKYRCTKSPDTKSLCHDCKDYPGHQKLCVVPGGGL